MASYLLTVILAFFATNIDDMIILIFLFSLGTKYFTKNQIIIGQQMGMFSILLVCFSILFGISFVDKEYLKFLGFIPIILGIKEFFSKRNEEIKEQLDNYKKVGVLKIALLALVNSGDNIGVYVSLFSKMNYVFLIFVGILYMLLTFFWCLIAWYISKKMINFEKIDLFSHKFFSLVLIIIGFYIIFG